MGSPRGSGERTEGVTFSKVARRAGPVPTLGSESHSVPATGRVPLEDAGPVGQALLVGKRRQGVGGQE